MTKKEILGYYHVVKNSDLNIPEEALEFVMKATFEKIRRLSGMRRQFECDTFHGNKDNMMRCEKCGRVQEEHKHIQLNIYGEGSKTIH